MPVGLNRSNLERPYNLPEAEHGSQGVSCFALHPGAVATEQMGSTAPAWLKPYLTDKGMLAYQSILLLQQYSFRDRQRLNPALRSGTRCWDLRISIDFQSIFPKRQVCERKLGYGRVGGK